LGVIGLLADQNKRAALVGLALGGITVLFFFAAALC